MSPPPGYNVDMNASNFDLNDIISEGSDVLQKQLNKCLRLTYAIKSIAPCTV